MFVRPARDQKVSYDLGDPCMENQKKIGNFLGRIYTGLGCGRGAWRGGGRGGLAASKRLRPFSLDHARDIPEMGLSIKIQIRPSTNSFPFKFLPIVSSSSLLFYFSYFSSLFSPSSSFFSPLIIVLCFFLLFTFSFFFSFSTKLK